ncbi:nuclease-related domain-containing protein [Sutcliffiella halmapala]|uniref:nuclease-related domain-containing protein n=1 Tax=Sutcliffiella halmapala TaxID=79882 RepID=UPI001F411006|nr:nuclease-related domain-containing protein [Sutcliffiella halmapala]
MSIPVSYANILARSSRRCYQIIGKIREESFNLEALTAACTRLSKNDPLYPLISAKQLSLEAGIAGEDRVAEILRQISFPMEHRIFHDLTLKASETFQIDSLLITQAFSLIFEVKNISGKLTFKEDPPQLIRVKENAQIDGFDSPAAQVERNVELFQEWLQQRGINIPVFGVVVLAYPKQIVDVAPKKTKVLFPKLIPTYIKKFYPLPKKFDSKTLDTITAKLIQAHQPFIPNPICQTYNIPKTVFQTGVLCTFCGKFGMTKIKKSWQCPSCKETDRLAHQKDIRVWFLLIGRKMTNSDCREFLRVDDPPTAYRLLQSMKLQGIGVFKKRIYYMDFNKKI